MPGARDDNSTGGTEPPPQSVLLIDDHPVVALGIRLALGAGSRFALAQVATDPAQALSILEDLRPDVVIADLVFDGVVEVALIGECRRLLPHAALVVFSSLPARIYERDVLDAGADRYVLKDRPMQALIAVMDDLTSGAPGRPSDMRFTRRAEEPDRALDGVRLTRREVEIGRRLSMGLSAARIGEELGLSANTVAVHRDNIRKKLSCRDSAELISRLARLYPGPDRHA